MTEQEFHRARRMFIVIKGTVLRAPVGDQRTHVEWLSDVFGHDLALAMINTHTRGYVLGRRMVVYKGQDFSHHVDHADVMAVIDDFDPLSTCRMDELGFGARYTPGVQPWPAKAVITVREYRQHARNKKERLDAHARQEEAQATQPQRILPDGQPGQPEDVS